MSARTLFWSACSVGCLVSLLGACAEGGALDDDGDQDSQDVVADAGSDDAATITPPRRDAATGSSSSSSGEEATSSSSSGGSSSSSSGSTSSSSSGGSSSSSSGGSSSSSGGSSSSSGGSSSSSGGSSSSSGGPYVCAAAATCVATPSQANVRGDYGSDTFTATGTQSQWVHFRLLEDDDWDDDLYLSARIGFTGAAGATYQLNVRSNCAVSNPLVVAPGAIIRIDDSGFPDDTKDIWVEVKQLSGACPTAGTWKLKVTGNE